METTCNSKADVEPYEEEVGYLDCRTPVNSRASSPTPVAQAPTFQSAFYGPISTSSVGDIELPATEFVLSAPAPQPDPARIELAACWKERAVVGAECVRGGGRKCATSSLHCAK